MRTRIIGDIHGKFRSYLKLLEGIDSSIQVGDFGIGRFGLTEENCQLFNETVSAFHSETNRRFIRGNHDDPEMCKTVSGYVHDGTVINDNMFVGGAFSIDWVWRTEGIDWWRDEEIPMNRWNEIISIYEITKPRVMFTHDCPESVAKALIIDRDYGIAGKSHLKTITGQALQAMFEIHQPEEWYFGHWHVTISDVIEGTKFTCLNELDCVDVELNL